MKTIAPYIRTSKHSQTLLINQLSLERIKSGDKVFKFGFGQSPFPVPEKIRQALANSAHRKEYMSVQGHPPLREAIASFHNSLENKNLSSGQIIVGAGSKILIYCLLAAFECAEVLLPAPSWVSYAPQARLAGHSVSWLETSFDDNWKIKPEQLDSFCNSRTDNNIPLILVFNYPSNPTGQTYSAQELQALALIMRKHNIIVIVDEIYSLLSFAKDNSTLDQFYPEASILTSGLSKWCGAGGWRLGFTHIPEQFGQKYFQAVLGVASETYSCAPSPIQMGATLAYEDIQSAKIFLGKQIKIFNEISRYCTQNLRQAGVNVHEAQGGFYLFPEFKQFRDKLKARGISTSEDLTNALMNDRGVALLPGSAFGMTDESLTVRLAFVDFDGAQILNNENPLPNLSNIRQGIEEICNWLHEL